MCAGKWPSVLFCTCLGVMGRQQAPCVKSGQFCKEFWQFESSRPWQAEDTCSHSHSSCHGERIINLLLQFLLQKKMSALHPIFCLFQPCMTSNICRRYLMPRLFFSKERWIPWNSIEKQKKLDHKLCRIVIENNSSSQFWSRLKLPTFILYGGNINNTLKSVYKLIINLFHRGNRPNHFWSWYIS